MTIRSPGRDRAFQYRDVEIRAFQVEPSWYDHHWYGVAEPPRTRRSVLDRRVGAGLAAISFLAVAAVGWL
ncbi:MAG: hypothetical protein AB7O45_12320 [Alphaproteobacteria bacterium]